MLCGERHAGMHRLAMISFLLLGFIAIVDCEEIQQKTAQINGAEDLTGVSILTRYGGEAAIPGIDGFSNQIQIGNSAAYEISLIQNQEGLMKDFNITQEPEARTGNDSGLASVAMSIEDLLTHIGDQVVKDQGIRLEIVPLSSVNRGKLLQERLVMLASDGKDTGPHQNISQMAKDIGLFNGTLAQVVEGGMIFSGQDENPA